MIDINNYEKIAECVNGRMKWLSDNKENIVYLMMFGQDSYVGSTKNVHGRFRQCSSALRRGEYDISKVQEAFDVTRGFDLYFIEKTSEECLRQREKYWIDELKPTLNTHLSIGQTMEVFIKREMQRKGINNRQLAAALGVGDSYASGISRGDKNLSMNTLQQVADVLQVPVWRLLAPEEVADAPSIHSSAIICPNCGHEIKIKVEQ